VLAALASAYGQTGAQYKFITIEVPDTTYAEADGINNARLITGFYEDASSNAHGFVWRDGALQTVDYPGAVSTSLNSVNNQDVAVAFYVDTGGLYHTVTYSVGTGGWTALPDIPGYPDNLGEGINDAGEVVGYASTADFSASVGWVWRPSKSAYSFLADPAAARYATYPASINDKGQIAGYYADSSGVVHGFRKEGSTYTTVDAPGADDTFVFGIDNGGSVVGEWYDAAYAVQGFVQTSGGLFTTVDYPGPLITILQGDNDHGDVCGGYVEDPSGAIKAFVGFRQ
jgi:hypothetical protein